MEGVRLPALSAWNLGRKGFGTCCNLQGTLFSRKVRLPAPETSVLEEGTAFHTLILPCFAEKGPISCGSSLHPTRQGMLLGFFQNPDPRKPSVSRELYHTHSK